MDLYAAVIKSIRQRELIKPSETVLCAVSGGADSVCLLHILYRLQKTDGFSLRAAHIHHGIRRKPADRDASFVSELCASLDIPCEVLYGDALTLQKETPHMSLEDAARQVRYRALSAAAEKAGASKIAVAHNADDNAETFLFRLFRGTGVRGLSGIPETRDRIIRPLLSFPRTEIEAYLKEQGLTHVTDETNEDLTLARNAIRKRILKDACDLINPQAARHTAQAAGDFARMRAYLEKVTGEALERCLSKESCKEERILEIPALLKEDPFLRGEVLYLALASLDTPLSDIGRVHIEEILSLCAGDNGRAEIALPCGVICERRHRLLHLRIRAGSGKISRSH